MDFTKDIKAVSCRRCAMARLRNYDFSLFFSKPDFLLDGRMYKEDGEEIRASRKPVLKGEAESFFSLLEKKNITELVKEQKKQNKKRKNIPFAADMDSYEFRLEFRDGTVLSAEWQDEFDSDIADFCRCLLLKYRQV